MMILRAQDGCVLDLAIFGQILAISHFLGPNHHSAMMRGIFWEIWA